MLPVASSWGAVQVIPTLGNQRTWVLTATKGQKVKP